MSPSPITPSVTAAITPGGPSGSRRHGPARATAATAAAHATASAYRTRAGCPSVHHGTRLARNVPAGTEAAQAAAARATARMRARRRSPPAQGIRAAAQAISAMRANSAG